MPAGLDPRTPVLVGTAAITQRSGTEVTAGAALDAVALMAQALRAAADDAGGPDPHRLIDQAGIVMAPQGSWVCIDPARMVGEQLGIAAKTLYAELGVLQQTLFTRAAMAIAGGSASVVLICGGEARARVAAASHSGTGVAETVAAEPQPSRPADAVLAPEHDVISKLVIARKLYVPARQYAIMETAMRAAAGQSIPDHARAVAALWDGFADVARTRPEAWKPDATPLGDGVATDTNPWYAWPYTRQHCSYWTVDQAAGHILCSVEAAEAAGIPRDKWVFPLAAAESNAMVPLSARAEPSRSPAIAANGHALTELTGVAPADAAYIDLYSCFPAAVRMQAAELGISADRSLTVTGGMAFGGGPLNNYVLQSTARMMQILREDPGAAGLLTSISGMITKQGMGLWSTTPPEHGFRAADTTQPAYAATATAEVDPDYAGPAQVLGYTVGYERGKPDVGILIAAATHAESPTHVVATTEDPQLTANMTQSEWIGRDVEVAGGELR
jgi:acetyl-CoA C-acetyltransferase